MTDPDRFMLGMVILLATLFIGQRMSTSAMRELSDEKKNLLIDLFQPQWWRYASLIGCVVVYYLLLRSEAIDPNLAQYAFFLVLIVYIIVLNLASYQKLKRHDFPPKYIQSYLSSATIRFAGLCAFFTLVIT